MVIGILNQNIHFLLKQLYATSKAYFSTDQRNI